ncbi:hypothetical protein [Pseudoxanthomonas indica]|uniref:DUF4185 domain-containing protein n=1 Tax=Pseudoxanthomonas indica TaxID=428993 RepID=A0A1T5LM14_9GAMM|nr:hypothetical protein [Pseudoxanthomonas indica]GGD36818.1 hypothetical protein GCM10007235_06120 [Pseudoxanthomonas indica]SKC76980.1 hypothetical protein SAMN06296058_2734 [Pseudoxanthomonas indica]
MTTSARQHGLSIAIAVTLAASAATTRAQTPAPPQLAITGSVQTFHDSALQTCGTTKVHIDGPVRLFRDQFDLVHMTIGDPQARGWQWTGSVAAFNAQPSTATLDCTPIMIGDVGNNTIDRFDQKTFLQALHFDPATGYVYGYGHNDYFGRRISDPDCQFTGGTVPKPQCWYSAIAIWKADALNTSPSGHLSFSKLKGVPWHIAIFPHVAYPGDTNTPTAGWIGYGAPSNIVRGFNAEGEPDGYYYFFAYTSSGYGDQDKGVCLFRSDNPALRENWRAWTGSTTAPAFTQRMNNPYISATAPCPVVNAGTFQSYVRSVHWHAASRHYVAVFRDGAGVRYATSRDLVNWNPSVALYSSTASEVNYPSLVDLDGGTPALAGDGHNFDVIHDNGKMYLYFRTSVVSGHTRINRLAVDISNYP